MLVGGPGRRGQPGGRAAARGGSGTPARGNGGGAALDRHLHESVPGGHGQLSPGGDATDRAPHQSTGYARRWPRVASKPRCSSCERWAADGRVILSLAENDSVSQEIAKVSAPDPRRTRREDYCVLSEKRLRRRRDECSPAKTWWMAGSRSTTSRSFTTKPTWPSASDLSDELLAAAHIGDEHDLGP